MVLIVKYIFFIQKCLLKFLLRIRNVVFFKKVRKTFTFFSSESNQKKNGKKKRFNIMIARIWIKKIEGD